MMVVFGGVDLRKRYLIWKEENDGNMRAGRVDEDGCYGRLYIS